MATSTRENLVRTAHDLFYVEGFLAIGLDRILREVGVTKTTFYNHFESKDDLILAVLDWHDAWWKGAFSDMLRRHGGDKPRDRLLAIPDMLEELFAPAEFNGCIFINVAVQFPQPSDPAHQAAARHKQAMGEIIRELAAFAGADDPAAVANEVSLVLEGSYVTRQVNDNGDTTETVRRLIGSIVERHLPTQSTN